MCRRVDGVDAAVCKSSVSGLCGVLAEAARLDLSAARVASVLEEAGWSSSRVSSFSSLYSPQLQSSLRSAAVSSLSSFPSSLPSLASASHQSDLYLRSNLAEQIRQPVTFLTLHTQGGRSGEGVEAASPSSALSLTCSAEDLQDLLAKVREAVKAATPTSHAEQPQSQH